MPLTILLALVVVVAALTAVLRSGPQKSGQVLSVACLVLAALYAAVEMGWISFPAGIWRPQVLFPCAVLVLSLFVLMKIKEKSFALLMIFASGLQALVELDVVTRL
jgi:hypothetical protein